MSAGRTIRLILDGAVDEAVTLGRNFCEQGVSAPADIALMEPRMQHGGHFGRLAIAYQELFSTLGLETIVLHRRGWDGGRRPGWRGVFPIPDHPAGLGKVTTARQLEDFGHYFEQVFHACLQRSEAGLAVFPTVRYLTILAAVRAVARTPGAAGGILGVMETGQVPDCDDPELVAEAFREAARAARESRKSFQVFAESDTIRDFLLQCGFDAERVAVNPYPAAHRFEQAKPGAGSEGQRDFGCLGGTREVHNPGLLAAYLLSPSRQPLPWTVRLNLELAAAALGMESGELRRALRAVHVTLLDGHLEDASYDRALQSLAAMLLPYGDRYRTIGSGIFLESLCAGIPPLVPAASTMRRLYLQLGGYAPAVDVMTVEGIDRAVESCHRNLGALRDNAQRVRAAWLEHEQGPLSWSRRVRSFTRRRFEGRA